MSEIARLRRWVNQAPATRHISIRSTTGAAAYIYASSEGAVRFEFDSGEQPTVEAAATKVIEVLATFGEEVPPE